MLPTISTLYIVGFHESVTDNLNIDAKTFPAWSFKKDHAGKRVSINKYIVLRTKSGFL